MNALFDGPRRLVGEGSKHHVMSQYWCNSDEFSAVFAFATARRE